MLRWLLGFGMLSMLSACSPVNVLNALAPRAGITETTDIRYAPGDRHELDIYAPQADRPAPVVVFIYGGGWKDGNKAEYRFVAAALAARGFLTVVPDYRLFPEVRFPAFLQDNAAAVAWTRANISRYGGDPHRIFLMGHSAGAYNVAMLTLDKQWLAADGLDPDRDIAGTIGLAGPYDFLPLTAPDLEDMFGPPPLYPESQPIEFVRPDAPPMLLVHGALDRTVWPKNSINLAAALRARGVPVRLRLYPELAHADTVAALSIPARGRAPTLADIEDFVSRPRSS